MTILNIVLGAVATLATVIATWFAFQDRRTNKKVVSGMVDWDKCFVVAEHLLRQIKEWNPDLVIGIGRSGGIWGGWMAGNLGSRPFGVVDDYYDNKSDDRVSTSVTFPGGKDVLRAMRTAHPETKKVLLIEGASAHGETIRRFLLEHDKQLEGWEVRVAVLFVATSSNAKIDYVGIHGPEEWPDRLPWHRTRDWRTFMKRKDAA